MTDPETNARIDTWAAAGDVLARLAGRFRDENDILRAEVERLKALVRSQAERIAAQSELLSKKSEAEVMLVITRKLGEKVYIGAGVCVTVVGIDLGKIRLGIEAPRDVKIFREELLPHAGPAAPAADRGGEG